MDKCDYLVLLDEKLALSSSTYNNLLTVKLLSVCDAYHSHSYSLAVREMLMCIGKIVDMSFGSFIYHDILF